MTCTDCNRICIEVHTSTIKNLKRFSTSLEKEESINKNFYRLCQEYKENHALMIETWQKVLLQLQQQAQWWQNYCVELKSISQCDQRPSTVISSSGVSYI